MQRIVRIFFKPLFIFLLFASINNVFAISPHYFPPIDYGILFDWHCIKGETVKCIAVGYDEQTQHPVLIKTLDGGATWQPQIVTNIPAQAKLNKAGCSWDGSICIATGYAGENAFAVQSTDHLATWHIIPIVNERNLDNDGFKVASCTGEGQTAFCAIVGSNTMGIGVEIYQTQNAGGNWKKVQHFSYQPTYSPYKAIKQTFKKLSLIGIQSGDCAGIQQTASCVVYGNYWDTTGGGQPPYYVATYDGGKRWDTFFV